MLIQHQSFIRTSFLSMIQRTQINHFEDYQPVDEAVALNFENYNGPGPENDSRFHLFFGSNWRKSRWNRVVILNMLPVILYRKAEVHLQGELGDPVITAMLWDYIKQAQESWQRRNPRIAEEGNRVETVAEARLRADTQALQRSVKVRRNARKVVVSHGSVSVLLLFYCCAEIQQAHGWDRKNSPANLARGARKSKVVNGPKYCQETWKGRTIYR